MFDPEEAAASAKKRGAQPGHAGHRRRDYSHLPVKEEVVALPEESLLCPICGKPAAMMSDTEDSEVLEVDRYSSYKAMTPVKNGLLLLGFCWAHVRRDFVGVGKSCTELTPWAWEQFGPVPGRWDAPSEGQGTPAAPKPGSLPGQPPRTTVMPGKKATGPGRRTS